MCDVFEGGENTRGDLARQESWSTHHQSVLMDREMKDIFTHVRVVPHAYECARVHSYHVWLSLRVVLAETCHTPPHSAQRG